MCGIIGFIGRVNEGEWRQTHELLSELFVQSKERGVDSSGFAAVTSSLDHPNRHRLVTDKEPIPADDFTKTNPFWRSLMRLRCCSVLGHVRWATSGAASDNRNNHPFAGNTGGYAFSLVHNGVLFDVRETADRLAVKLSTNCDSELAEKLISVTGNIPLGLRRCLTDLRGSMALAVIEHRTGTIWMARDDNRPLWIARLKDRRRVLFASTAEIICRAVERVLGDAGHWLDSVHPVAAGYVHGLTTDGRLIAPYPLPAGPRKARK